MSLWHCPTHGFHGPMACCSLASRAAVTTLAGGSPYTAIFQGNGTVTLTPPPLSDREPMLIPDQKTVAIMAAIVYQAQKNKKDDEAEIYAAQTALSLWWAVDLEIDTAIRLDAEDKATRS